MNPIIRSITRLKTKFENLSMDTTYVDKLLEQVTGLDLIDIKFASYVDFGKSCWTWKGKLHNGYGTFCPETGKQIMAHHYLWSIIHGEPEKGKHLDHLCRNKACVNPYHLEQVTPGENIRRARRDKERCKKGHWKAGYTYCPECKKEKETAKLKKALVSAAKKQKKKKLPKQKSTIQDKLKSKRISYTHAKKMNLI